MAKALLSFRCSFRSEKTMGGHLVDLLLRAGSALHSHQGTQSFVQSHLENLQGWDSAVPRVILIVTMFFLISSRELPAVSTYNVYRQTIVKYILFCLVFCFKLPMASHCRLGVVKHLSEVLLLMPEFQGVFNKMQLILLFTLWWDVAFNWLRFISRKV